MPNLKDFPLLAEIDSPEQLRRLPTSQLKSLADELREYLIKSVIKTGGHLSAGLGTVELTIAIHYVFNTPDDRLIWDVGHQSYPHKILTGRRDQMGTIRQKGGISGFPKRSESPYDTFGRSFQYVYQCSPRYGHCGAAKGFGPQGSRCYW